MKGDPARIAGSAWAGRWTRKLVVPSWEEHLRQHRERLTSADRRYEAQADALSERPQTAHLIAADPPE